MRKLFSKKVYSVDEITNHIKKIFEKDKIMRNVQVKGEISNFRHHNSKHMYFNLKDENSIIGCAMFERLNQDLDFKPKDGIEVVVTGYIEVYKKKGEYQIIAEEMQIAGEGALYLQFLRLKEKLEKEGLFDEKFKKPIPRIPSRIGIVTSLEGAAVKDIIKTISKRFPHVNILIYPSLVQGREAKHQIERGIQVLNQFNTDVIIVARGGGSFEDLWPFNEEVVARAIFNSKTPIITGIGHEIDFTIADFVADQRAHTPSAAAEMAVPDILEIKNKFLNLERRLRVDFVKIKEIYNQRFDSVKSKTVFRKPFMFIESCIQSVDEKESQLTKIFINSNELIKKDVGRLREKLGALNPRSILNRGYSITMKNLKIVKSTKDINREDVISTIFTDGEVKSVVK